MTNDTLKTPGWKRDVPMLVLEYSADESNERNSHMTAAIGALMLCEATV